MDNQQITLHFDPYAYVRILTMKSLLFKKEDYQRLIKMSLPEITKHLQDNGYKKEIDAYAMKLSGIQLLEKALTDNLSDSFKKLKRIVDPNMQILVNSYLLRYDIYNFKTIMRAKLSNKDLQETKKLLIFSGIYDNVFYDKLFQMQKIEDVLLALPLLPIELKKQMIKNFNEKRSLFTIENNLDKFYAEYMIQISQKIPKQGELFQKFIVSEVDATNAKMLIRSKKENLELSLVKQFIIPYGIFEKIRIAKMYSKDMHNMINILEKTTLSKIIKRYNKLPENKKTTIELEMLINKHILDNASLLTHQHPLSIYIILGYMVSKDIEIKNLKMLIKAKQLEINEEFIEQQIIA